MEKFKTLSRENFTFSAKRSIAFAYFLNSKISLVIILTHYHKYIGVCTPLYRTTSQSTRNSGPKMNAVNLVCWFPYRNRGITAYLIPFTTFSHNSSRVWFMIYFLLWMCNTLYLVTTCWFRLLFSSANARKTWLDSMYNFTDVFLMQKTANFVFLVFNVLPCTCPMLFCIFLLMIIWYKAWCVSIYKNEKTRILLHTLKTQCFLEPFDILVPVCVEYSAYARF